MDGRDRGGVATPVQQLIPSGAALSARADRRPVPRTGDRRARRHPTAGVRLPAGAGRRAVLARALPPSARRARPVLGPASHADDRLRLDRARARADHSGLCRRSWHRSARPHQARHGAAARGAAPGARGRPRLPDRAVGLAGPADRALADRLAHAAGRAAGAGFARARACLRSGAERDPVSPADDLCGAGAGSCGCPAAHGALARLRPGPGLAQGGPAAGLSADPPAGVRGARVRPVGGRHGDRARPDHAANLCRPAVPLVPVARPDHALPGRRGRRPADRHRGPGDRALARARSSGGLAGQAMAGPWRPRRRRRHGAPHRMARRSGPVRVLARQSARPRAMVGRGPLALPGRSAAVVVAGALAGSARGAGAADLDDACRRPRRHRHRDRAGRGLSREREPPPAAPRRGRPRPALHAAPGAADQLPVRGPGAVPVARAERRLAGGDLEPSAVRPALRVLDARRTLPQPGPALRAHRPGARQAALAGVARGSSWSCCCAPS